MKPGPNVAGGVAGAVLLTGVVVALWPPVDATAQLGIGPIDDTLNPVLDSRLPEIDSRLEDRIRQRAEERLAEEQPAEEQLPDKQLPEKQLPEKQLPEKQLPEKQLLEPVTATAGDALEPVAATAGDTLDAAAALPGTAVDAVKGDVLGLAGRTLRPFLEDADPSGWPIERNVLVVLLPGTDAVVDRPELRIIHRQPLPGLDLSLITLEAADRDALLKAADNLAAADPDAAVDFNHLYRLAAETAPAPAGERVVAPPAAAPGAGQGKAATGAPALRIGLIDTAVAGEHAAWERATIIRRDFVTHEGERPLAHGTAVASRLLDRAPEALEIQAASVFFQGPDRAPGASVESLVLALEWLSALQLNAINISLTGPPNAVLERALQSLPADGPAVVAAVGNHGPAAEPRYPAAYPGVIGATAVDGDQRIYRYANHGAHVDFAALGVDLPVADAAGGWRRDSGTSMAAPEVTVIAAGVRRGSHPGGADLGAALAVMARDLGPEGFDTTFGHGLLESATPETAVRILSQD